jgi:indolepyruvate ferredoxin oxidoreductase
MNSPLRASSKQALTNQFTQQHGIVYLTGIEALVRLSLDQIRLDRQRGLRTGMFISGYRGSPIGMLDHQLQRQQKLLEDSGIVFVDGLNEDLAATAVWGTQMLHAVGRPKYDGVVGMWYGKAPGVDRSGDAFKHANYTGIGRNGGVLAVFGDDPGCKSSSLPSQSEAMFYHVGIPSLYPADVQEILDFGLHGYYLSRVAGLWAGLKIVTNVADGYGEADVCLERLQFVKPSFDFDGRPFEPQMNLGINVRPQALEMERSLYEARLKMARLYAYANGLNRITLSNPSAWLGIVTAGKTYRDLRQALSELDLDEATLRLLGVRILKMGMLHPIEPRVVREFASGLEEILVLEEKRPFVELFLKEALYGHANAPRIVGKRDEHDQPLLPGHGEFESDTIARVLVARMARKSPIESGPAWIKRLNEIGSRQDTVVTVRTPWYCSGCPHNSSTVAPIDSLVGAGIGCHTMAMWMNRNVVMGTHMGAEGAQWIGMAPFTDTPHIFQNMGDGTYFHSGSLAIRYAAAAGVNITYKLLYNGHVSMTGGQEAMGRHPVSDIAADLRANGVSRVIVTSDHPEDYSATAMPDHTEVWHRDRILEAQSVLASTPGTTVLIHDQECAAELRRLRARGKRPNAATRVVINERVCEGCGDCGVKSNCMSVEPVDTEFGRKTRIHQSSCNQDQSCVKGFCPSFLTIESADGLDPQADRKGGRRMPALDRKLPEPIPKLPGGDVSVHVMGIGGTGSVTVASTIASAARLDGKHAIGLDQTGLAQKGGAVISHIRITREPHAGSNKITDGCADLYLGFDILTAADPKNLTKCDAKRTVAVVSTTASPTGYMISDRMSRFPPIPALRAAIDGVSRQRDNVFVDGQRLAEGLFGDSMATNLFMVGVAHQAGALPVSSAAIEQAIRQGGVGVEVGILAFRWGRMAVVDLDFVESQVTTPLNRPPLSARAREIVDSVGTQGAARQLLEIRVPDLIDYQNERYAQVYAATVKQVADIEQHRLPGKTELTEVVARYLYKLMAYKDEYEVARLLTDPAFLAGLERQFRPGYRVRYQLAPPLFAKRDPVTGELQKRSYGTWMLTVFRILAKLKGLRGGPFDLFGRDEERRQERQLIDAYRTCLGEICEHLTPANYAIAVRLASIPDEIRGYGHVKRKSIEAARALEARLVRELKQASLRAVA